MRIFVRDNDARFFFSSRRRHTRSLCDWSSDVCSSDLPELAKASNALAPGQRLEHLVVTQFTDAFDAGVQGDRKSTRLNSSHTVISYAVFCLKKKKSTSVNCYVMASINSGRLHTTRIVS